MNRLGIALVLILPCVVHAMDSYQISVARGESYFEAMKKDKSLLETEIVWARDLQPDRFETICEFLKLVDRLENTNVSEYASERTISGYEFTRCILKQYRGYLADHVSPKVRQGAIDLDAFFDKEQLSGELAEFRLAKSKEAPVVLKKKEDARGTVNGIKALDYSVSNFRVEWDDSSLGYRYSEQERRAINCSFVCMVKRLQETHARDKEGATKPCQEFTYTLIGPLSDHYKVLFKKILDEARLLAAHRVTQELYGSYPEPLPEHGFFPRHYKKIHTVPMQPCKSSTHGEKYSEPRNDECR